MGRSSPIVSHPVGRLLKVVIPLAGAVALGIWAIVSIFSGPPCTIFVDDNPVATVSSRGAADAVMARTRSRHAPGIPQKTTRFSGTIQLRDAGTDASPVGMPEAVRALQKAAPVQAEVYAVIVDGKPAVGLLSKKDAERTLRLVKEKFVPKRVKVHSEPVFKESVRIEKRYINADLVQKSPTAAADALTKLAGERLVHTVQRGDRAARLAAKYGTTLQRLIELNPLMDLDRLEEGDEIFIHKPAPSITVVHRAMETRVVTIKAPAGTRQRRRGSTGRREIRSLMTYENGEPVGEEVISQVTTWE